jgi:transmembrane sensor
MSQNDHIITLIAKQLQGLATPQEAEELQQWLQSDDSRRQEYDDMVMIWQKSGPLLANNPQFNTEVAWVKLDDQIAQISDRPKEPYHNVISFLFSNTKKAAAAIVVLAVIAFGGYWWYKQAQWQTFAATNTNETIILPDRSVVLVRKGSSIQYPRTFDARERQVKLKGEAFFTVQHNEAQPFLVITDNAEVKVLGTTFVVNEKGTTDEIVVLTGKVRVSDKRAFNKPVILTRGQRAFITPDLISQPPIIDSNYLAWATGHLVFQNTALPKVLEDISQNYGAQIELAPALKAWAEAVPVTVEFKNQPLEQALEEIRLITGLQLKKENDKMIFYRN